MVAWLFADTKIEQRNSQIKKIRVFLSSYTTNHIINRNVAVFHANAFDWDT